MKIQLCFPLIIIFLLVACQSASQSPSQVTDNYLKALIAKDPARLISYSCKSWENEAQKEMDSFMNVGLSLENAECLLNSQSSTEATVICNGSIKLTYETEILKIDLSKRAYHLVLENYEWRICGLK